ncbi:MAG: desulfoferrodoxin family protein [Deferribacterota bacterium]|nr:desulfoferrodoxin family protein [Deferribacterota bacterium]
MERRDFLKSSLALVAAFGLTESIFLKNASAGQARNDNINRLENKDNPSSLEQGHVPKIIIPSRIIADEWFDVVVKVGFINEHPSTQEHWITDIKLLVDGEDIAHVKHIIGGITPSEATFRIKLQNSARLEAIEHCNLHGTWISEPVEVRL